MGHAYFLHVVLRNLTSKGELQSDDACSVGLFQGSGSCPAPRMERPDAV